jgi:hypothetical protein
MGRPVAVSGEIRWPLLAGFLAAYGEDLMAADTAIIIAVTARHVWSNCILPRCATTSTGPSDRGTLGGMPRQGTPRSRFGTGG